MTSLTPTNDMLAGLKDWSVEQTDIDPPIFSVLLVFTDPEVPRQWAKLLLEREPS